MIVIFLIFQQKICIYIIYFRFQAKKIPLSRPGIKLIFFNLIDKKLYILKLLHYKLYNYILDQSLNI